MPSQGPPPGAALPCLPLLASLLLCIICSLPMACGILPLFSSHMLPACAMCLISYYFFSVSKPCLLPSIQTFPSLLSILKHRTDDPCFPLHGNKTSYKLHLISLYSELTWVFALLHAPPHTCLHTFTHATLHTLATSLSLYTGL